MGFCLEGRGIFSGEARRESFVVHYDTYQPPPEYAFAEGHPHPEFAWADLDDLVEALLELREHAREHGIKTARDEPLMTPSLREGILDAGSLEVALSGPPRLT